LILLTPCRPLTFRFHRPQLSKQRTACACLRLMFWVLLHPTRTGFLFDTVTRFYPQQ
jgi:hypothetical protein